jgi:flagellar biosynthesis/type III secretory pathway ATPase
VLSEPSPRPEASAPDLARPGIPALLLRLDAIAPYRVVGRVRRCRGSLLVCEGLSALVGLGDSCYVQRPRCNLRECDPERESLLAEVVAIDRSEAHLLPFDRLEGVGIGAA